MQTFYKNNKTHKLKLYKSIDNKLFDLLVDLDAQMAQGYENNDLNIILKYYIISKLLVDKNLSGEITYEAIKQNITLTRTNTNQIYVDQIQPIYEYEPGKYCPKIKYKNKYEPKEKIIKKYEFDFEPLINYIQTTKRIIITNTLPKKFINIKPDITNRDNYINPNVSQFNNKLHIYLPLNDIDDSDPESDNEQQLNQIHDPYINKLEEKQIDIQSKHILQAKDKNEIQQLTKFIGKRTENHRDKDRDKYLNKLLPETHNSKNKK